MEKMRKGNRNQNVRLSQRLIAAALSEMVSRGVLKEKPDPSFRDFMYNFDAADGTPCTVSVKLLGPEYLVNLWIGADGLDAKDLSMLRGKKVFDHCTAYVHMFVQHDDFFGIYFGEKPPEWMYRIADLPRLQKLADLYERHFKYFEAHKSGILVLKQVPFKKTPSFLL